jgi:hypothetical protein
MNVEGLASGGTKKRHARVVLLRELSELGWLSPIVFLNLIEMDA